MYCFWNSKGILYYEPLPQAHTVIAVVYSSQRQKFAEAVWKNQPRRPSLHLLQDNIRLHVAKATHQKIEEVG